MKKLVITAFLFGSLMACYKDNAIRQETASEPITKAQSYLSGDQYSKNRLHKITPDRAMRIAEEARNLFADENERRIMARSAGGALAPAAVTKPSRARSTAGADTLMYVVNYNDGGYVFVSNDDRDGEILMYAGGGNFQMQDTADNPGLKLHIEMIMAYQEHKLDEMRAAEARGEEYMGTMTVEEVPTDEFNADARAVGLPGMPGEPAHTCNVAGSPGLPGLPGSTPTRYDICAPANYESKYWDGDDDAIALAKKRYKNEKCFGVPVAPPSIDFAVGGTPGPLGPGTPCPSPPYCDPPLWNYDGYYFSYGAKMSMHYKTVRNVRTDSIAPLLTTTWHQRAPLNNGKYPAGCGPIAIAQILAYHQKPKTYGSKHEGVQNTNLDILRTFKTNKELADSGWGVAAQKLVWNIGDALDVTYSENGTGVVSLVFSTKKIRDTFWSLGYSCSKENVLSYQNGDNFHRIPISIKGRRPVLIYGFPQGALGPTLRDGHIWVLDGYKAFSDRKYYADYYFDEFGKFNAENRYILSSITQEYVHANMGWDDLDNNTIWVNRGIYIFGGKDYSGKLFFIADIQPRI